MQGTIGEMENMYFDGVFQMSDWGEFRMQSSLKYTTQEQQTPETPENNNGQISSTTNCSQDSCHSPFLQDFLSNINWSGESSVVAKEVVKEVAQEEKLAALAKQHKRKSGAAAGGGAAAGHPIGPSGQSGEVSYLLPDTTRLCGHESSESSSCPMDSPHNGSIYLSPVNGKYSLLSSSLLPLIPCFSQPLASTSLVCAIQCTCIILYFVPTLISISS